MFTVCVTCLAVKLIVLKSFVTKMVSSANEAPRLLMMLTKLGSKNDLNPSEQNTQSKRNHKFHNPDCGSY